MMTLSMMRIRTMAVADPIRNSCSSFPTRDIHVLERGGRYYYYYSNYRQQRTTPSLMLHHRHRLYHYNHTHSLTTTTRRLQQQQQRSIRSQASFPKKTATSTTTASQQQQLQQLPLPSSSSSSSSNSTAGDFTVDLISLYSILFQRAALAAGIIYCFSEYVADITLCEGPSMAPTLHPYGEIVLIDKWSVRRVGVQDGCIGSERVDAARQRQKHFEQEHKEKHVQKNNKGKDSKDEDDQDNHYYDDDNDCPWHETRISVTQHYQMAQDISRWQFYRNVVWKQFTSPLSIGDVVVVQHPARRGTICKRVLGLPGDTVVFPRRYAASWIQQQQQQQQQQSSLSWKSANNTTLTVIPNGHVWLEGDNPANSSDSRYYGPIPMALIQGRVLFRVWPLRGKAWMHRGAPPIHAAAENNGTSNVGFTILPAGYEGQRIVKKNHSPNNES